MIPSGRSAEASADRLDRHARCYCPTRATSSHVGPAAPPSLIPFSPRLTFAIAPFSLLLSTAAFTPLLACAPRGSPGSCYTDVLQEAPPIARAAAVSVAVEQHLERRRGATPSTQKAATSIATRDVQSSSMLERKQRSADHRPCVLLRGRPFLCCNQPWKKLHPTGGKTATGTCRSCDDGDALDGDVLDGGSGMMEPAMVGDGVMVLLGPTAGFASTNGAFVGSMILFCWNQQTEGVM